MKIIIDCEFGYQFLYLEFGRKKKGRSIPVSDLEGCVRRILVEHRHPSHIFPALSAVQLLPLPPP